MDNKNKWTKTSRIRFGIIKGIIVVFALFLLFADFDKESIEFSVANQSKFEFEYGSNQQLEEVSALYKKGVFDKEGTPVKVEVEGQVEYDKVGTYPLVISAKNKNVIEKIEITVVIKDTQAPVITLTADPEYYASPGGIYVEEGFVAQDNYDGDITANVIREENEGIVTYKVSDSSGNETVVERVIVYKDVIAPELTLNGSSVVSIYVGENYSEAGYTAVDECDGDITANVIVEGSVNTQKTGSHTLVYKVTDSAGNTTEARRTVVIKEKIAETGEKVIYLTFDDGPSPYTEKLLDVLDQYGVKATFFVTGARPEYFHMIKETYRRGHTIAVHTYSHDYSDIYTSVDAYLADFNKIKNVIVEQTGEEPWLFRFPGGTSNNVSKQYCTGIMTTLAQLMLQNGYEYCDWSVSAADTGVGATELTCINNVINGVSGKQTAIVLQHDAKEFSVEAVDDIIRWALDNGYVFKAMDRSTPFRKFAPQN